MAAIATQQEAQSWYSVITDFPRYWENMQKNFQGLLAQSEYITTKHPELRDQYDKMVRDGSELYQKMYNINQTVSTIKNSWNVFTDWLQGAVGMSGLGILPAIPIAISAAAAASTIYLVGQWLTKAAEMAKRIELYKSEEEKGASPEQAALVVDRVLGKPSEGTFFGFPVKWLVIGGIALFALPVILPMLKGRK
jgi:hypothetical protein